MDVSLRLQTFHLSVQVLEIIVKEYLVMFLYAEEKDLI